MINLAKRLFSALYNQALIILIVGSCSVVTKDIPSNSVAAGVPAKVIKSLDEYTEKVLAESLELGHLSSTEKEKRIKLYYGLSEK